VILLFFPAVLIPVFRSNALGVAGMPWARSRSGAYRRGTAVFPQPKPADYRTPTTGNYRIPYRVHTKPRTSAYQTTYLTPSKRTPNHVEKLGYPQAIGGKTQEGIWGWRMASACANSKLLPSFDRCAGHSGHICRILSSHPRSCILKLRGTLSADPPSWRWRSFSAMRGITPSG
jgi:hypothetical protein